MTAKTIMIQGTGSDVGKSVLTAGLCRLFTRKGYQVAPFKSQNMALNSYITERGGEIGRAQAVQAEAARVTATVDMNPVLLKPNQDDNSQLIIHGEALKNMTAKEYFSRQKIAFKAINESLNNLKKDYQLIVIEGAGSPAEINLRDYDLVNMRIAELIDAPVLLVADIDKGGVFASIIGTLELLTAAERNRIKGIIINKFRGSPERFLDGVKFIEEYTNIPVVGIIPFINNIKIPEEDSLAAVSQGDKVHEIDIAVIYLPHISNFTDFDLLAFEPGTRVRYFRDVSELGDPDLIIIPGSKNTIEDLQYLYQTGLAEIIKKKNRQGTPVIGICGGYQMLGKNIKDPLNIESTQGEITGLGLLDLETYIDREKITRQVKARVSSNISFFKDIKGELLSGYEIHHGRSEVKSAQEHLIEILDEDNIIADGIINENNNVWGTYLHGIFDNDHFRRIYINHLRIIKGLKPISGDHLSSRAEREKAYDQLADLIEENISMTLLNDIIAGER